MRAHEAAHQWWGNIVTFERIPIMHVADGSAGELFRADVPREPGTDRSLSTTSSMNTAAPTPGKRTRRRDRRSPEGPVVQGRRLENSNNPNAWNAVAYGKGTLDHAHGCGGAWAMRSSLKMLGELRRRYEWKSIDTEQFRRLCAEFMPKGSSAIRSWRISSINGFTGRIWLRPEAGHRRYRGRSLTAEQLLNREVPDDFSVTVPVEIQTGRGRVVREVQTSSDPVSFSVPVLTAAGAKSGARSRFKRAATINS